MNITPLAIPEVLVLEPRVFCDSRGFFFESYNQNFFFEATGCNVKFVQDNHSRSSKGVLRGLHYQLPPKAQGKLMRVVRGSVFDVAVDIRKNSPTLGQWVSVELSEDNQKQLWIPPGFAHGFVVISESVDLLYKTTDYYSPELERCIQWDDPDLAIDWPIDKQLIITSTKDSNGLSFSDATAVMYDTIETNLTDFDKPLF